MTEKLMIRVDIRALLRTRGAKLEHFGDIQHKSSLRIISRVGGSTISTQQLKSGRKRTFFDQFSKWFLRCFAICTPIWLLLAHLDHGADSALTSTIYSFGLSIALLILLVGIGFHHIPSGMTVIAVSFLLVWGLFHMTQTPITAHEAQALAAAGAIVGIGYFLGRRSDVFSLAWSFLNLSLLVYCGLALIDFVTELDAQEAGRLDSFDGRLTGFFFSPNTAATLFGLASLLALARILSRLTDRRMARMTRQDRIYFFVQSESVNFVLLLLACACLLMTDSRAGISISSVCLMTLGLFELFRASRNGGFKFVRRKRFWFPVGVFVLLALTLTTTGLTNPHNSEDLFQNSSTRLEMYDAYVAIWLERPLFGHGLGSFNAVNNQHMTLDNAANLVTIGAAHNVFLQWLVQTGIVGVSVMIVVFTIILYPIIRALWRPANLPRLFIRMSLAATVLVFGHGLVDYALEIPSVMWTYSYILGLSAGLATKIVNGVTEG